MGRQQRQKMTVGITYTVEQKYQGFLGTAHVTDVVVDGHKAGEIDVFPATALNLTRVEAVALRHKDDIARHLGETQHSRLGYEAVEPSQVRAAKERAAKAIVRYWHDNTALRYGKGNARVEVL